VPPAEYTGFSSPTPVAIAGYSDDAMEPFLSKDGQRLYFNNSNDASVDTNLFYATRVDDLTFVFQGPVMGVNSAALDGVASLDTNGVFYFVSTRDYPTTLSTLYRGILSNGAVTSVELVPGVSRLQAGRVNFDAEISADGHSLWFVDSQFANGAPVTADLVVAELQGATFVRRADSDSILAQVNTTTALEYAPCISVDALELFFTRWNPSVAGDLPTIYRATRSSASSPFGAPQRVAAAAGFVEAPTLSADGRSLYFHSKDGNRFVIYRAAR
jgi:hypothetical protein